MKGGSKGQPILSAKQQEMHEYLQDRFSLEDAIERFKWHERGVYILTLLLSGTERQLKKMER